MEPDDPVKHDRRDFLQTAGGAAATLTMGLPSASVPIPKFARVYRTLGSELRNRRTLASYNPSAALNPKFAIRLAAIAVRTSGSRH